MTDILIRNGTLITDTQTVRADLRVVAGKIAEAGANLQGGAAQIVDAEGLFILPGGVDAHVHLDLPMFGTVSSDDHYTGTKAAAFGGTTTVIDFISLDFPTFQESVDAWSEKAQKACVDYAAHMNLTRLDEKLATEIPTLCGMGITSLKTFTAYNKRLRLDDGEIFRALRIARENGILVLLHAEDGDVIEILVREALGAGHTSPVWHGRTRPAWGAVAAALRAFALSATADAPLYLVHMNTAGEVDMLQYARERGLKVMGETCPQYLLFTDEVLSRPDGAKWICSPPLRQAQDAARLWIGLADGSIQTIGTDHCPFFFNGNKPKLYEGKQVRIPGKELGRGDFSKIPNGLPGIQDRLPVLWTKGVNEGRLTPNQFVSLTSTNPAKIFGLYPRKGALLPGSDADLVLWDPKMDVCHGVERSHQRTDYNLYEGWELKGYPVKVFLRGELIVDGDRWLGRAGMGEFLHRKPNAPIL